MREVIAEPTNLKIVLGTYQGAVGKIRKELRRKIEYYSKMDSQASLEKYGFERGEKREWFDCIKDSVLLIDKDYVDPETMNKENAGRLLKKAHKQIVKVLMKYVSLKSEYYSIIALWIIGTYFHQAFYSFPFLFFNAMKSSGKTRLMKLVIFLAWKGEILSSPTEAVLFRTSGTLGIDEAEGLERKGRESIRELLNSCYKKGTKIKRMKQQKTIEGTQQVVEEFKVYRPIVIANIYGMESVLGDRCIPVILEKSFEKGVVNLMEIFDLDDDCVVAKELLEKCRKCCLCCFSENMYKEWNSYILCHYNNNTNNTNSTNNTNNTNSKFNFLTPQTLKSLDSADLNGRELELSFPLMMIASSIDEICNNTNSTLTTLTAQILKSLFLERKGDDVVDNSDLSLIDFVSQLSQQIDNKFHLLNTLVSDFKVFSNCYDSWINAKWMGRALKRTGLLVEKKRAGQGLRVRLNIQKALNKIGMFKETEENEKGQQS